MRIVSGRSPGSRTSARPVMDYDGAQEIDVQKPVVEGGVHDLYPFGEDEVALKLTRGDPPVQKDPLFVIHLLAANDELLILNLDRQFIRPEPGDGKGDAQALLARLLHVVGGVAVAACLADSVEPALELIEAEQKRAVEKRYP